MDKKEFCSFRHNNSQSLELIILSLYPILINLNFNLNGTLNYISRHALQRRNKFRETLRINISTEGGNSFGLQQQVLADQSSMSPPRGGRCPGKVTCNSRNRGGQVTRDCHARQRVYISHTRARTVVGKNGQTLTNRSPFHNSLYCLLFRFSISSKFTK